jgi:hypothetical protein
MPIQNAIQNRNHILMRLRLSYNAKQQNVENKVLQIITIKSATRNPI